MGLFTAMRNTVEWMMQLLHPHRCVLCRKTLPTGSGAMICPDCAPRLRQEYRNTKPVFVPGADSADAPLLYTGALAGALKRYKFHGNTALCKWFSAQAAACLSGHLAEWQPDCLTYVPLGTVRWWGARLQSKQGCGTANRPRAWTARLCRARQTSTRRKAVAPLRRATAASGKKSLFCISGRFPPWKACRFS